MYLICWILRQRVCTVVLLIASVCSRGAGAQLSYTLSANVQPVVGECNSYRDCMPVHSSDHPTKGMGRDSDSDNGD